MTRLVFRGHQPLLIASGVFLIVFSLPVIVGLLMGELEPQFWWWAGLSAFGGMAMLGYRARIVFLKDEVVTSKGFWIASSLTKIPRQSVKELTLFGVLEGDCVFSLWLTLGNGKRLNLESVGELGMVGLERTATQLSEYTGFPLRKDESFYQFAKSATNAKQSKRRFAVGSLVVMVASFVAATVLRLSALLGEDSVLQFIGQLYRRSPSLKQPLGLIIESFLWLLGFILLMIVIGSSDRLREPKD